MDITNVVSIVGIIQVVFLLVLIVPNSNKIPNRYATYLLLVLLIDLTWYLSFRLGALDNQPIFWGLGVVILFLYGPILYYYVKYTLQPDISKSKSRLNLHLIPALVILICSSPVFLADNINPILNEFKKDLPVIFSVYSVKEIIFNFLIWYGHVLIYIFLSLQRIRKFEKNNQGVSKHIKWLKTLTTGYIIFAFIGAGVFLLKPFFQWEITSYEILNVLLVFHIFVISYIGYTKQDTLSNPIQYIKYKSSTLKKEKQEEYLKKLLSYFEHEKPYLDQDLTISQVSSNLNILNAHLSQVINNSLGQGFNEFVNSYRVDLAKELIIDPEKEIYTIEAIANEAGFRSKSSFNSAFKKKLGMTPSQFKAGNKS